MTLCQNRFDSLHERVPLSQKTVPSFRIDSLLEADFCIESKKKVIIVVSLVKYLKIYLAYNILLKYTLFLRDTCIIGSFLNTSLYVLACTAVLMLVHVGNFRMVSVQSTRLTDTRYNVKSLYNGNLNVTKPSLNRWQLMGYYARILR